MQRKVSIILALLLCAACQHQPAERASWAISAQVKGHTLTIASSPAFAGAISSLTWKDKEFIDRRDHGRELQSAASFDGLGECFNPTEAGSAADGADSTSTSKLLNFVARGTKYSHPLKWHSGLLRTSLTQWGVKVFIHDVRVKKFR
jgi:hypothetical protein